MEEAIAAVATGGVRAAIGIVRLTGAGCIEAVEEVFSPAGGGRLTGRAPGALVYGRLADREGRTIDRVLATYQRAPRSYTGEDAAELHCHGSPAVLALALESLFARGVRQAGPGEFTRRAFLNGKLDLLEAEGVADLIDAQTPAAVRTAAGQLSGALSDRVAAVYDELVELLAHFHATVDYPDEDLAPFGADTVTRALDDAARRLEELLATYRRGRLLREGVPCAIVGRPNAGKSSLLNALVGYERAIVTPVPGTTRDTVEESCVLGEVLLRLIDTAGLRDTADQVERLGVERSRRAMAEAGLILVVTDRSLPPAPADADLLREAAGLAPTIHIVNKCDLPAAPGVPAGLPGPPTLSGSLTAHPEALVEALAGAVARLFPAGGEDAPVLLTNLRQAEAAREALQAVERARAAHRGGLPPELVLTDVEAALSALAALTGRRVRSDVVERIFSRFCVGK